MSKKAGANIKKIRKSLGYTQTDVAEKLFTTAQNISRVESGEGEPTVEMLVGLSELFGVSIDTLLCHDVLSESELLNRVRSYLKNANRDETPQKVFRVCKKILYGRYDAALNNDCEVSELPTYSTIRMKNLMGVFSDRTDRPAVFAAVGTNTVELCENGEATLIEIFRALSDKEVLQIIKKLSRLYPLDKFYDKPSFCSAFGVDESNFEYLVACLAVLKLITAETVAIDSSTVTLYHPFLSNEIVLLLSLSNLLYNASPDGSAH